MLGLQSGSGVKSSVFIKSLGELHAADSTAELIHWALNIFSAKFGTECAIWTQYDRERDLAGASLGEQTDPTIWQYGPIIQKHLMDHPIFQILSRTGKAPTACKATDFAAQRVLDETPLFRKAYRNMSSRYQLAVVLESPTVPRCTLSFGRSGSDYSTMQVRALQESARHFLTALSKLRKIEELEKRLTVPGSLKFRAFFSGIHWHYAYADESAVSGMARNFGEAADKFTIPPPIAIHLDAGNSHSVPINSRCGHVWNLTSKRTESNELLVCLEPGRVQRIALAFPNLTARELESALWLCEGKSNPEIAKILGVSPKTVEKHLENLFGKLNVETRLAASLRLLGSMS
jgi:DNA-binding CsgD family transcriptional regulator